MHDCQSNILDPKKRRVLLLVACFGLSLWWGAVPAVACPFCSAASQTLSEEIARADVVVLAELAVPQSDNNRQAGIAATNVSDPNTGMATFRILEVLRGAEKLDGAEQVRVVYFGDGRLAGQFMVTGIGAARTVERRIDWSTPLPLSPEAVEYVRQLGSLPEKGPDRYRFFLQYFENDDPLLAQDAYDEFSRAPYAEIIAIADIMDRKQLVQWINDPQVGPTRRRLYLTMLGVCGGPEEVEMLESLLQYDYQQIKPGVVAMVSVAGMTGSAFGLPIVDQLVRAEQRRKKQCLDALVACYLKLKGPDGLPLVEERFLKNPAAEYTHVYSTIMALRFHGEETDVIPRERLLQSLRLVLDNREIADQIIPDLARWEDWAVLDRLVSMFKSSAKDDWIRQPVVSYLIVAAEQPGEVGEHARQVIAELDEIDPKTVERARTSMAFSGFGHTKPSDQTEPATSTSADLETTEPKTTEPASLAQVPEAKPGEQPEQPESEQPESPHKPPSRLAIIGVPLVVGLVLMAIFAVLLRGSDFRSHD